MWLFLSLLLFSPCESLETAVVSPTTQIDSVEQSPSRPHPLKNLRRRNRSHAGSVFAGACKRGTNSPRLKKNSTKTAPNDSPSALPVAPSGFPFVFKGACRYGKP